MFIWYLQKNYISISDTLNSKLSKLFFLSTLVGYGFSTVWIETPTYLLVFWFFIALIQLYATIIFVKFVSRNLTFVKKSPKHLQALYIVFSSVFIIKAFLPFIALNPEVTQLAFFNVNIVMAYLHLILLVGISVFLIWKTIQILQIQNKTLLNFAVYFFVFGVLFNEFFLAIGAFTVFFNLISISLAFWLLVSSIIILLAILFLFISVRKA